VPPDKTDTPNSQTGPPANTAKSEVQKSADLVVPEVVAAVEHNRPVININILLAQVSQKGGTSKEILDDSERALMLAQKYEDHNLAVFKARSQAIIDFKLRDPDEIDKRANNQTRRILKYALATGGVGGLGGLITGALMAAPVVVTGLSGIIGVLCLGALAPLASGESVSSTDVVRIVDALADAVGLRRDKKEATRSPEAPRGKKGKR